MASRGSFSNPSSWFSSFMSSSSSQKPPAHENDASVEAQDQRRVQQQPPARKKPSKLQAIREGYESLVCAVIRPPRSRYSPDDLGPTVLRLDSGTSMERIDFTLENYKGLTLQCSLWLPTGGDAATIKNAVVYLHGNSSCRVDATRTGVLETVGPLRAALVAFDFSGSGLSDGDYVTLGWHEHHDVACVVRYLKERGFINVALWGRSMGAVSALIFAQSAVYSDIRPAMLILDSPFCSLPTLVDDLIKKGSIRIPRIAVKTVLSMVRSSVKKRTGADIYKLEPIKDCSKSDMPALFVSALNDEMIPNSHSASLNSCWGGASLQISFKGTHNSARPPHIYDAVGTFLRAVLNESNSSNMADVFTAIQDLCEQSPKDLPPGWLSATDPETGDTYYYDTFTQKTTWFRPQRPSTGYLSAEHQSGTQKESHLNAKRVSVMTNEHDYSMANSAAQLPSRHVEKGEFGAFNGFGCQISAGESFDQRESEAFTSSDEALTQRELTELMGYAEDDDEPPPVIDTGDAAKVSLSLF